MVTINSAVNTSYHLPFPSSLHTQTHTHTHTHTRAIKSAFMHILHKKTNKKTQYTTCMNAHTHTHARARTHTHTHRKKLKSADAWTVKNLPATKCQPLECVCLCVCVCVCVTEPFSPDGQKRVWERRCR